jgi:hypothetical protein
MGYLSFGLIFSSLNLRKGEEDIMKVKIYYKKCFEAMWMWLHKNPCDDFGRLNEKKDWPGHKTIIKLISTGRLKSLLNITHYKQFYCFACQTVPGMYTYGYDLDCNKCPVNFGKEICIMTGSYFVNWQRATTPEERAKYALLIAKGWKGKDV